MKLSSAMNLMQFTEESDELGIYPIRPPLVDPLYWLLRQSAVPP